MVEPVLKNGWGTHAALLVVQMSFAVGAVEGKLAMAPDGGGVQPFALAMSRMLGAALFFQIFGRAMGWVEKTSWGDKLRLAGLSMLGIVLNQVLFLIGLSMSTSFSAALLGATIPVLTSALAILFRQERASVRTALGLAVAVSGVLWLTGVRSVDRGAVLLSLNSLSYSLYLVFGRDVIRRLGAMTVMTWVFTFGALLFSPMGGPALARGMTEWSSRGWILVGVMVAIPTALAYLLNAWALGRSSASLVTIYIYLQPVLAGLLAWVQLGQGITGRMIVAALLIFAGVGIVAMRPAIRARDA
jgi:drug/metabolite transporter (DMT)-like permease